MIEADDKRIIVALDFPRERDALALVEQLDPASCRVKVGKELFTSCGPALVEKLQRRGFDVFLDLKFHDIPHTVSSACRAAAELGVWMVNVHASGGRRMMAAAREGLEQAGQRPLLIAVTVLTSLTDAEIAEVGLIGPVADRALALARLAAEVGLDGVVCSARESAMMRAALGEDFCLVTPGIRPADAATDDQRRVVTPADALRDGSDFLVIGRPVTRARRPADALAAIRREILPLLG